MIISLMLMPLFDFHADFRRATLLMLGFRHAAIRYAA